MRLSVQFLKKFIGLLRCLVVLFNELPKPEAYRSDKSYYEELIPAVDTLHDKELNSRSLAILLSQTPRATAAIMIAAISTAMVKAAFGMMAMVSMH